MTVIILLAVIWAIVAIVGFAFKGLLWLAIVGIVLFIGTVAIGYPKPHDPPSASVHRGHRPAQQVVHRGYW